LSSTVFGRTPAACASAGQMRVECWSNLVKRWSKAGQMMVKCRSYAGQTLVKCWSNAGQTPVKSSKIAGRALVKHVPSQLLDYPLRRWSNTGHDGSNAGQTLVETGQMLVK
jgi:hypothetical protein